MLPDFDNFDTATGSFDLLASTRGYPVCAYFISLFHIAATENGEACACDLTEPAGRSQATVSHHLSQLTQAGILEREQRGKWAWFALDRDHLSGICAAVCATSVD